MNNEVEMDYETTWEKPLYDHFHYEKDYPSSSDYEEVDTQHYNPHQKPFIPKEVDREIAEESEKIKLISEEISSMNKNKNANEKETETKKVEKIKNKNTRPNPPWLTRKLKRPKNRYSIKSVPNRKKYAIKKEKMYVKPAKYRLPEKKKDKNEQKATIVSEIITSTENYNLAILVKNNNYASNYTKKPESSTLVPIPILRVSASENVEKGSKGSASENVDPKIETSESKKSKYCLLTTLFFIKNQIVITIKTPSPKLFSMYSPVFLSFYSFSKKFITKF